MLQKCFEQKYEVSQFDTTIYRLSFHNVRKNVFTNNSNIRLTVCLFDVDFETVL